ncbi:MAG TPA: hypothetical protein VGA66_02840 [Mycobacterium sp.]
MPDRTIWKTVDEITTGKSPDELRAQLTWAFFETCGGSRRASIVEDCRRYDINVDVRVDPEMLEVVRETFEFKPPRRGLAQSEMVRLASDPDAIPVWAGGKWRVVTSEWRSFDLDFAVGLAHDQRDQMRYGAHWRTDVYRKVQAPDGSIGDVLMTESNSLPEDEETGQPRRLFQFKFDHEPTLVIARS